jgi:O-antigen/teichoic acid export membrane protein
MVAFDPDRRHAFGRSAAWSDVVALFRQGFPLGVAGLMVAFYDSLAVVMLSKLSDMQSVAEFAAVTRFVYPVIIIVQSLNSAFYPLQAAAFRNAPRRFRQLQQTVLELSIFVGGGLFCGIFGGAAFLLGLMGPSLVASAGLMRLMSCVVLLRSVTTAMSPLVVVVGRQRQAMWLTGAAVILHFLGILILVPRFGIMGAAFGYLGIELLVSLIPISIIGLHYSGLRLDYGPLAKLLGSAAAAAGVCQFLPIAGTLWGGVSAGVTFLSLAILTGGVSVQRLRGVIPEILNRRPQLPAPPVAAIEPGS